MIKGRILLLVLIFLMIVSFCSVTFAQPPPPDPGNNPPPPNPVPIGGIEILIGAGALLGAKRLYHLRKPKS